MLSANWMVVSRTHRYRTMNKLKISCLFAVMSISAMAVEITVDKVTQRYPWNGLVDIDYTITYGESEPLISKDDHVEFTVIDNSVTPAVRMIAADITPAPIPVISGKHRVTWNATNVVWDATQDTFVTNRLNFKSDNLSVEINVRHYPVKYMVIDLSGGSNAATYPVEYFDAEPLGGFNKDEYKDTKLVLRMIPPGSFVRGRNVAQKEYAQTKEYCTQHRATITKPFYIGIFELTKAQYTRINGGTMLAGDARLHPQGISYKFFRGTVNTTSHTYEWPYTDEVDPNSVAGLLRSKVQVDPTKPSVRWKFDLPTDKQWEYACRAGVTNTLPNGVDCFNDDQGSKFKEEVIKGALGRSNGACSDGRSRDGSTTTAIVGSYNPNNWGLYDMIGNLMEWVLDKCEYKKYSFTHVEDSVGANVGNSNWRFLRGGSYYTYHSGWCRPSGAAPEEYGLSQGYQGVRIAVTVQ